MLLLACLGPGVISAQRTEIGAPVENFRLPVFGEDGNRAWDLRGEQAVYRDDGAIDVTRMLLRTFPPGRPLEPDLAIESPDARLFPQENRASGEGYLFIEATDGSYAIVGRCWEWHGDRRAVHIAEEARVNFKQALGGILE